MPALPEPLGPWHPADYARRPQGMVYEDWQPWQAWLKTEPARRSLYAYNVRLSAGDAPASIIGADDRRLWQQLTDKRIDAVGRDAERFTIYEARRITGWSAIGQLLGYCQLWRLNFPELELEPCMIVTERIDDAIRSVALRQGLRVYVASE